MDLEDLGACSSVTETYQGPMVRELYGHLEAKRQKPKEKAATKPTLLEKMLETLERH